MPQNFQKKTFDATKNRKNVENIENFFTIAGSAGMVSK